MTRAELLQELRQVLSDEVAPYGWHDRTLMGYLAEGQDVFCEETGFFVDKSNYSVTTQEDVSDYTLDPRIYKVLEVWDGDRRLRQFREGEREGVGGLNPQVSVAPQAWQADGQSGTLTLYGPGSISADTTLTLRVWRYSRVALDRTTGGVYDASPEIPGRFQRACVEYAAYKAFNHHDKERQDPVKAADHYASFTQYCNDGARAFRRLTGTDRAALQANPLYSFR